MITRSTQFLGLTDVDTGDSPGNPAGTKAIAYGEGARSASFNRPLASLAKSIDQLDWSAAQEVAHRYIVELSFSDFSLVGGFSAVDLSTPGLLPAEHQRVFHGSVTGMTALSRYFRVFGEDGQTLTIGDGSPLLVHSLVMSPTDTSNPVGTSQVINGHTGEAISGDHRLHGIPVAKTLADDASPGDLVAIGGGTANDGTYRIRRIIDESPTDSFLELMKSSSAPVFDDTNSDPLVLDDAESGGTVDLLTNGVVTTSPTVRLSGALNEHELGYTGTIYLELGLAYPLPRIQSGPLDGTFPTAAKNRRIQGYARRVRGYKSYADPPGLSLYPFPFGNAEVSPHLKRCWNAEIATFRNLFSAGLPTWSLDDPSCLYASAGMPAAPPCPVALSTRIPPGSLISSVHVPYGNTTFGPLDVDISLLREAPRLPSVDVATLGYQVASRPEPYAITAKDSVSHSGVSTVEYLELILPSLSGYPMFYTGTTINVTDDGSNRYTFKVASWGSILDGIFAHGLTVSSLSGLTVPFMGDYLYVANGDDKGVYPIVDLTLSGSDLEVQVLSNDALVDGTPTVGIPSIIGPNTKVSVLVDTGLPLSASQLQVYTSFVTTMSPNDSLAAGFPF